MVCMIICLPYTVCMIICLLYTVCIIICLTYMVCMCDKKRAVLFALNSFAQRFIQSSEDTDAFLELLCVVYNLFI